MTDKAPIIIVIGPQGSGKGTQVELLSKEFEIPSISAGDLLRTMSAKATDLGRKIGDLINNGKLVTIDLWEAVVGEYIDQADLSKGYIFEGVLRTLEQVEKFNRILEIRKFDQPWVLEIRLDDETATQRLLLRGRHDDTEEAIRTRLAWSRKEVQPVIDYYQNKQRLISIDGNQSIEKVHSDIVGELTKANILPEANGTN